MKLREYDSLDATGLAELVRRKQVKPIELVDTAIERIERLNPTLARPPNWRRPDPGPAAVPRLRLDLRGSGPYLAL